MSSIAGTGYPPFLYTGIDGKPSNAPGKDPPPLLMDLAEEIKGMYRLLDLISESGSNGCGNEHFPDTLLL